MNRTATLMYKREKAGEPTVYRFVAATEGKKDDGIDLSMSGALLDRFKANPILMVAHDYSKLPVGKVVNVFIEGTRLLMDVVFDTSDELGAAIERKVKQGFLNALSIGFKILEVLRGRATAWELLEVSVVGLPMDAEALLQRAARQTQTPQDALLAAALERLRADLAGRAARAALLCAEANRVALLADLRRLAAHIR